MPLFLPDGEFRLLAHDPAAVAEAADAFIRDLHRQIDVVRAEADAASIAAEQTCALLEQKYASLSCDLARVQSENARLSAAVEQRLSEVAEAQAEKHQLVLKAIAKDGEIERMTLEAAELHKSKRQLLGLLEQKDAEISERNATIQSYLDKIVFLTENTTSKNSKLHETEAELARCNARCSSTAQEKELLVKHNAWLDEELTAKVKSLVELRRTHMDVEADMSAKLADLERQYHESSTSLKWSKERVREMELRVNSLEEELISSKDAASANEERFAAELSTVTRLVELYKASSEEWSKKAGELEGVIKALETHLSQVENDYKEKLEKEMSIRKDFEKEAMDLREKLHKCESEIENMRKSNELKLLQMSSFHADHNVEEIRLVGETDSDNTDDNRQMIVSKVPIGISGTALAASLLRDGWSLAKMYEKYHEAADALRHEKWGRKHAEAILERVLHEIEAKAEIILDERAEHERMVEAYTLMDQKLQHALSDHDSLENTIRKLKSELKMRERDCNFAQKEINDLQKQITVLLKECQDVQLRCGGNPQVDGDNYLASSLTDIGDVINAEEVISNHLLTFKDINGLVEQNVQLRSLVRKLSSEDEKRDAELKEDFQIELQKVTDEAAAKVEAVLKRSEEQASMIESLHSSVAMYKRLYEEERKIRASSQASSEPVSDDGKKELMGFFEGSQEVSKKAHEQLSERAKNLEKELSTLRNELMSLRSERDKITLVANFARERLDSFMKEFEIQKQEANAVSGRNVELTHLLIDYQKRLREHSDSLQASEENSRKLSMEVSILKHEKEILINTEKRMSAEVRDLSDRVHSLQSTLDTVQSAEEVRENARAMERRKHDEYLQRVERDWAEAKKELQEERDHVRTLMLDREKAIENSMRQVEEMRKELADAWRAVTSAESRAAVAEARCSDLEAKINLAEKQVIKKNGGNDRQVLSANEVNAELWKAKQEMEKLEEEARVNKEYMLQYKEIARTNEVALKQIESAHEEYKSEAERLKKALEDEIQFLQSKVSLWETNYKLKSEEAASATEAKENALSSAMAEISSLRDEVAIKLTQIEGLNIQLSSLKDDLDKEHKRWRTAQDNYERQVILQSETIQELTNTSKELSSLQTEIASLKEISEAQKTEYDLQKISWEIEKSELQLLKNDAEKKYNEINEQNKLLHNRLEALHIRLAEKERSSAGLSSNSSDSQVDSDLQNVISYLRRSKEIAETEISLLKQEKTRLQAQLESALKASETAQALVHSQSENTRTLLFKEEEFKSLQLQVREINLLRESNMQLREENKHNFGECQKLREEAQKAKVEVEKLGNLLMEKQVELDACRKEMEMQKLEIGHLNNRIAELLDKNRNIDFEEYESMKNELPRVKELLAENEVEVQKLKTIISEKQESISNLEQVLAKCQLELSEQEKKLKDALQVEGVSKQETEKQKNHISLLKRKNETLSKEKEELNYKIQALSKQIEDAKSSRKTSAEYSSEQSKKEQEKDARIQMLERTLEREREDRRKEREDLRKERDDNKKEKLRRQKTEKTVLDLIQTVNKDKKKVEEELSRHKHAIVVVLESTGVTASQLPTGSTLDEQTSSYFHSIGHFEEAANSFLNDSIGATNTLPTDSPIVDASAAAGRQVTTPQRVPAPHVKPMEERSTILKPSSDVRKASRRIIRPRLERPEEPTDTKISGAERSTTVEEGKASSSYDHDISGDISIPDAPARKRPASASVSEPKEAPISHDEEANVDVAPPSKKPRDVLVSVEDVAEVLPIIASSSEHSDAVRQSMLTSESIEPQPPTEEFMEADQAPALSNEEVLDIGKDEDEDIVIKEDTGEKQKEPLDGTNQDDDVQSEGDQIVESLDDKVNADECLKGEILKEEMLQSAVDESEDEREEGELMPDELDEQQEDGAIEGDGQHGTGDGAEVGVDSGDLVEVAAEKSEEFDAMEEVAEGSDKNTSNNNDQGDACDSMRSPQRSSVTREESPVPLLQSSVSHLQSPTRSHTSTSTTGVATSETDETGAQTRSGRTISISERARQNALLRQARMPTALPQRGRGRSLGSSRRDGSRGRGGRAGRGQSFGDREQS